MLLHFAVVETHLLFEEQINKDISTKIKDTDKSQHTNIAYERMPSFSSEELPSPVFNSPPQNLIRHRKQISVDSFASYSELDQPFADQIGSPPKTPSHGVCVKVAFLMLSINLLGEVLGQSSLDTVDFQQTPSLLQTPTKSYTST